MPEIDTANKFFVGVRGRDVMLMKPVAGILTADDAILLAAYLVSMAEIQGPTNKFEDVLNAIRNA